MYQRYLYLGCLTMVVSIYCPYLSDATRSMYVICQVAFICIRKNIQFTYCLQSD